MEILQTSTEKQYDEICRWLGDYTKETKGITKADEQGNLIFYVNAEKIVVYRDLKKFEIGGSDKENINFLKKSLEHIIDSERRGNDLE